MDESVVTFPSLLPSAKIWPPAYLEMYVSQVLWLRLEKNQGTLVQVHTTVNLAHSTNSAFVRTEFTLYENPSLQARGTIMRNHIQFASTQSSPS